MVGMPRTSPEAQNHVLKAEISVKAPLSGCGFWDPLTRYWPGDSEKVFDRRVGPVIDSNHVRDAFDGPVCGSDN